MLSFNQLSHACPLQEENIPLHSCNLQGLHHIIIISSDGYTKISVAHLLSERKPQGAQSDVRRTPFWFACLIIQGYQAFLQHTQFLNLPLVIVPAEECFSCLQLVNPVYIIRC